MHKHTNTRLHKYTNTQMHKHTNARLHVLMECVVKVQQKNEPYGTSITTSVF